MEKDNDGIRHSPNNSDDYDDHGIIIGRSNLLAAGRRPLAQRLSAPGAAAATSRPLVDLERRSPGDGGAAGALGSGLARRDTSERLAGDGLERPGSCRLSGADRAACLGGVDQDLGPEQPANRVDRIGLGRYLGTRASLHRCLTLAASCAAEQRGSARSGQYRGGPQHTQTCPAAQKLTRLRRCRTSHEACAQHRTEAARTRTP
jgi:hypothetical protein